MKRFAHSWNHVFFSFSNSFLVIFKVAVYSTQNQNFSINLSVLAPNHNIFAKKVTNSSLVYFFFQKVLPKKETRDLKAYTKRNVFPLWDLKWIRLFNVCNFFYKIFLFYLYLLNRNNNFPEIAILICYELTQLKLMINPLRPHYLPASVQKLLSTLACDKTIFTMSNDDLLNKIRVVSS